ncbi:MAG: hypothetical protein JOZ77_08030 [Candidatus Eremiobacteraeota bacterium]|nr:hypothetical protein [Candidatus Eremiobacteraeota bacterium]
MFRGFRGGAFVSDNAGFLKIVGQTFMPGTPYMLRGGGLASYTSGILTNVPDSDVPQEFALIGYSSADRWQHLMTDTLQGRMYNSTHGGVYDMSVGRSGAQFPSALSGLDANDCGPFYTWGEVADWQTGSICVYFGQANGKTTGTFRIATRTAIGALKQGDYDCLICSPGDTTMIVWAHCPALGAAPIDWTALQAISTPILSTTAQRILWEEAEPPLQTFTAPKVMNWIFVRDERYFLQ